MANSYSQVLVQLIFVVKRRENLIAEQYREPLEKYICGLVSARKCKPLAIYCNPDHCHLLVGLHPDISISDLARDIKANSTNWLNRNFNNPNRFSWQRGFAVFSYNRSQLRVVAKYIENQPFHHKKQSSREEYIQFLDESDVDYDPNYIFDFFD